MMSAAKGLHIGISAVHVRPGQTGSHEPYMMHLVRGLCELETAHRFTLFVTRANRSLFADAPPRMNLVVCPPLVEQVWGRILFEQFGLPFDAERRKLDVLHYGGTVSSIFVRGTNVVTIHHDSTTQRASMSLLRNYYFDFFLRWNRRAGKLIVPSHVYAEQLISFYGYHQTQMCPVHHGTPPYFTPQNAPGDAAEYAKWGVTPNPILAVTNTLPHKNLLNLLRAYDLLVTQHEVTSQLVLVGNLKPDILNTIIQEASITPEKLRERTRIVPFLRNDQLPPFYRGAAVLVFVSLTETFGMPLTEAMACGTPILASDIPVHREVLDGAGVLVSPTDPAAIAAELYQIITDSEKHALLKRASLTRAKQFTLREMALQTVRVYEAAWQQSQGRPSWQKSLLAE